MKEWNVGILEGWKDGRMEEWDGRNMGRKSGDLGLQRSCIPLFHCLPDCSRVFLDVDGEGLGGVAGDLGGGGGGVGEGDMAAEAACEADFDMVIVEVAGEAGDMDFDDGAEVGLGGVGGIGDEGGAGMRAVVEADADSIDAGGGRMGRRGWTLAVGKPRVRPTARPRTTSPARAKGRPSMVVARGMSPAATAARMRVLETGVPASST
jgi:hypothetical protein